MRIKRAKWRLILVLWRTPWRSHPSAPANRAAASLRVRWRSLGSACGGSATGTGRSIFPSFQHHRKRRAQDNEFTAGGGRLDRPAASCCAGVGLASTPPHIFAVQLAAVIAATVRPPKKSISLPMAPPIRSGRRVFRAWLSPYSDSASAMSTREGWPSPKSGRRFRAI